MDKKIIIGFLLSTILIIGGAVLFSSNQSSKAAVEKISGAKIELKETNFDFKNIPYSGGNAIHKYPIKNIGNKDLTIANLKTSCMCTKVYMKTKTGESPQFGMQGHASGGASNWTGVLKPGEEGQMVAVFDPTAHGPQGVGPIDRLVSFETSDPDKPYVELSFKGIVVK